MSNFSPSLKQAAGENFTLTIQALNSSGAVTTNYLPTTLTPATTSFDFYLERFLPSASASTDGVLTLEPTSALTRAAQLAFKIAVLRAFKLSHLHFQMVYIRQLKLATTKSVLLLSMCETAVMAESIRADGKLMPMRLCWAILYQTISLKR